MVVAMETDIEACDAAPCDKPEVLLEVVDDLAFFSSSLIDTANAEQDMKLSGNRVEADEHQSLCLLRI